MFTWHHLRLVLSQILWRKELDCLMTEKHFLWQVLYPPVVYERALQRQETSFKVINQPSLLLKAVHCLFKQKPWGKQVPRLKWLHTATNRWSGFDRKKLLEATTRNVQGPWELYITWEWWAELRSILVLCTEHEVFHILKLHSYVGFNLPENDWMRFCGLQVNS